MYRIGEFSALTGASVKTLRYYDEIKTNLSNITVECLEIKKNSYKLKEITL